MHKIQSRDRYITMEEMERSIAVLADEKDELIRDFILIALLTAIRKNNMFKMRWKDIRFIEKIWYISDTKNGKPQHVVLTDFVMLILNARNKKSNSEFVFPNNRNSSKHLRDLHMQWDRIRKKSCDTR